MAELNWIDAMLSAVALLSAVFGLFRGLIRGVFGIVSLIAAFFVARRYGHHSADALTGWLGESDFVFAVGYALLFVFAVLVFAALTFIVRRAAAEVDLGAVDKFGGFIFGALRGGLFGVLIVIVLALLPLQKTDVWNESALLPVFGTVIKFAVGSESLSEYGRYWRFDSEHRPRLALLEAVLESPAANPDANTAENPAEELQPHDSTGAIPGANSDANPDVISGAESDAEKDAIQRSEILYSLQSELIAQPKNKITNGGLELEVAQKEFLLREANKILRRLFCEYGGDCREGGE